ncbi:hypothetical protein HIM_06459 [Hirsutella minnesotensis 3608]|uniref:GAR domain-containing protein n=1 Tax=Hirsutella minnesotensis 3608 TaxID=1043627 RepID=A0A0F7ZU46_9HYPO|nr:hypothetical protein HIM_06459 [Hirsutella minnesotensis 3608]
MSDSTARPNFKPKRLSYLASSAFFTRQQFSDDLLTHLAPPAVFKAVTSPTGALRSCLECASQAEKDFAVKAAMASQRIWEWLAELDKWIWPTGHGSAGFQASTKAPQELANQDSDSGVDFNLLGSLSAGDVARYESRTEQIHYEIDELGVEDIKSRVLTNHITPLSRPGTPMTDSSHLSSSTLISYARLNDLSAVVAAIVLHMLPNMARLSRLLRVWTIRLRVLRRIPSLTFAIKDAEVGLTSGRAVLDQYVARKLANLKRQDLEATRKVLATKVTEPGRILDGMLDCLEDMPDTLPDEWLDRVDALEKNYSEWVTACERTIQEVESATALHPSSSRASSPFPVRGSDASSRTQSPGTPRSEFDMEKARVSSFESEGTSLVEDDEGSTLQEIKCVVAEPSPHAPSVSACCPVDEDDEPELPRLRESASGASLTSQASTLVFGATSHYSAVSSDPPEMSASPLVPPSRIRHAKYIDESPPSTPPSFPKPDLDDFSVDLLDSPIASLPTSRESMLFKSPADQSFVDDFDDSFPVAGSVSQLDGGDQQLQQQLSEIIEAIPVKIKLASEPTPVNLNPPDLKIPRLRRKPSKDGFNRSVSNMSAVSSRAGTPSFTLSPAKHSRPRHNRTHNDIQVYHLSRSTGEPPIKLFIRCVGEHGERVMVRVGGGWADLSEYLKDYASHHGRRSAGTETATVEVRDVRRPSAGFAPNVGSSPPRPGSAAGDRTSMSPLQIHKTRRAIGAVNNEAAKLRPRTPLGASTAMEHPPSSVDSATSESSSRFSWVEDDNSFLGLAGPTGKKVEMSEEKKAWVESVKEKVRLASSERRQSLNGGGSRFGDLGRVGSTQRVFRKL